MTITNPHDHTPPPSAAMVRIGGRDYPMVTSRRCHTCQSPHRRFIENEILAGRSYAAIHRQLAEMSDGPLPKPSVQGLTNHVKEGHLPQPVKTRRRIIEKRAEELGAAINGEDDLTDYITVNDLVINRGLERLMAGEIEPGASDLLKAIDLKHKIESTSQQGYDAEAFTESMFIYFDETKKIMSPEQWDVFARALQRNPILKAMMMKQEGREVIAGELAGEDEKM